jgi:hypothetical protein
MFIVKSRGAGKEEGIKIYETCIEMNCHVALRKDLIIKRRRMHQLTTHEKRPLPAPCATCLKILVASTLSRPQGLPRPV